MLQAALDAEAVILRAPVARGLVVAGTEDGSFALLDPRSGYKVRVVSGQRHWLCLHGEACCLQLIPASNHNLAHVQVQHSAAPYAAGLAAMDVRNDLVATAGYGTRQGRVFAETHVKVTVLRRRLMTQPDSRDAAYKCRSLHLEQLRLVCFPPVTMSALCIRCTTCAWPPGCLRCCPSMRALQ